MLRQQFGILHLRRFNEFAVHHDVEVSIQLFLYRLDHFGMAMPDIGDTDATDKVNIFLSISAK